MCCSVLQHVGARHSNVLAILSRTACVCCNVFRCVLVCCSVPVKRENPYIWTWPRQHRRWEGRFDRIQHPFGENVGIFWLNVGLFWHTFELDNGNPGRCDGLDIYHASVSQQHCVYCRVLQCVAVCCSVLQCFAVWFSELQCVALSLIQHPSLPTLNV